MVENGRHVPHFQGCKASRHRRDRKHKGRSYITPLPTAEPEATGENAPTGVRIFLWVKDVNALYEDVLKQGAEITMPIETRPYRIRDFAIRDPNGVVLVFGQEWD